MIKIWIDDLRTPPSNDWIWIKSVNAAKKYISMIAPYDAVEVMLSVDHDSGDYVNDGGDYIKRLEWLVETGRNYPIHIHSMNVVGRMNMEAICRRNGWTIVDYSFNFTYNIEGRKKECKKE